MKNKFNKTKKIVLEFDYTNNYDMVEIKHGKTDDGVIKNVRWVINCFNESITRSYEEDSPRRFEMEYLFNDLMNQIKSQLTKEEIENILET